MIHLVSSAGQPSIHKTKHVLSIIKKEYQILAPVKQKTKWLSFCKTRCQYWMS